MHADHPSYGVFMATHTQELLDKARSLCSPPTDYELAKRLGISKQTISRCRRHAGTLDNEGMVRLARFLEQDIETIMPLIELDRVKDDKSRAFWEKLAPRLVPSLVIGLLAAAAPGRSEAVSPVSIRDATSSYVVEQLIHYAKYVLGWVRRARSLSRASYRSCHA